MLCISVADMSTGRVGAPLTCCEIRLRDWAEGKTHLDHTHFGRMHGWERSGSVVECLT